VALALLGAEDLLPEDLVAELDRQDISLVCGHVIALPLEEADELFLVLKVEGQRLLGVVKLRLHLLI
jgi:hypothetical protein